MLHSKTRWMEKGEKLTKYFLNLEKRNRGRKKNHRRSTTLERKTSAQSRWNNGRNRELLRDLYTSNGDIEDDRLENFLHNLEIPKLQHLKKEELEGKMTQEECKQV